MTMVVQERIVRFAYHLEGQGGKVLEAEEKDMLKLEHEYYKGRITLRELESCWYLINGNKKLWRDHCDLKVIKNLRQGDLLTSIIAPHLPLEEAAYGRQEVPIAAVLTKGQVLYKMPTFELGRFLSRRGLELNKL